MSNVQIVRLTLEFLAIILVCYCVYRQNDIAKWEQKVWRYIKGFFKAVVFTVRDKKHTKSAKTIEFPIRNQVEGGLYNENTR